MPRRTDFMPVEVGLGDGCRVDIYRCCALTLAVVSEFEGRSCLIYVFCDAPWPTCARRFIAAQKRFSGKTRLRVDNQKLE